MDREKFLTDFLPLVGGKENTSLCEFQDDSLYVTLKDASLVELDAVRRLPEVTSAKLGRNRLTVCFGTSGKKEKVPIMANNQQIATDVLRAVGGKENVQAVVHCMTRLRFNLKDDKLPDQEEIKKIPGVLGVAVSGGQFQIIIGQNVPKVYDEVCKQGGFAAQAPIDENLDKPKEKLTLKQIGSNIMSYLSGSMTPLIPVMMAAAMFKTVMVLFGPDMLNLFSAESNPYILMDFLYDGFYYFLPIFVGYTAAVKLGVNPGLGLYAGAILVVPDFVALAGTEGFTVYGIPCITKNYSQTILPILLSIWVLSYIYKFFKKIIPDTLSTIFTPFLTMVVMVPIEFCLLAPVGSIVGNWLGNALIAFGSVGGFIAVAVVAAAWEFLVMTGMHGTLIVFAITCMMSTGYDNFVLVAGGCATWAAFGMALGAFLRLKDKSEKNLALSYFAAGILGGVTEPALYGIGFKYKTPFIALALGGAVGGLYAGITHVTTYVNGAANFLSLIAYVAGGTGNTINGIVASLLSMVVAAIFTYLFGFKKEDPNA